MLPYFLKCRVKLVANQVPLISHSGVKTFLGILGIDIPVPDYLSYGYKKTSRTSMYSSTVYSLGPRIISNLNWQGAVGTMLNLKYANLTHLKKCSCVLIALNIGFN